MTVFEEVLHALVCLATCASFLVMWSYADEKYFTTWALFMHATFFFASAAISVAARQRVVARGFAVADFVSDGRFARWVFAPCLVVSVAVATTVFYLLYAGWGVTWDDYCAGKSFECRDLVLVFVATHYAPPVVLLLASVSDHTLAVRRSAVAQLADERAKARARVPWELRYVVLLLQVSYVPTSLYATLYDAEDVYGVDGTITTVIYGVTAIVVCVAWGWQRA